MAITLYKASSSSMKKNFNDPFDAGQMIGMLMMLAFIEKNGGISEDLADKIKDIAASSIEEYMEKPSEDILLMVDELMEELNL